LLSGSPFRGPHASIIDTAIAGEYAVIDLQSNPQALGLPDENVLLLMTVAVIRVIAPLETLQYLDALPRLSLAVEMLVNPARRRSGAAGRSAWH